MLAFNTINHFSMHATDRDIGGCMDLLFDDQSFVIRYIVADTNTWLPLSRKVVISPISVLDINCENKKIDINMTADTLVNSPSLDEHKPVSREYEEMLFQYFGYGYYWIGPGAWGDFAHPGQLSDAYQPIEAEHSPASKDTNHLRSCNEINGYEVETRDGEIGHVSDFVFDRDNWTIKLVLINTHHWLPGGKTLAVTPTLIEQIDWASHKVTINADKETLIDQHEFDATRLNENDYVALFTSKTEQ